MKPQIMMVICIMYLFSCTAQQSKSTCELNYKKAKDELKEYSKSSKADYLSKAQLFLDSSLSCNETRKRSIDRKIQIYFMQKAYKQGAKFVNTLEISDFSFEYEKDMYKNYLTGLEYDKANDLKNRDSVFKESIKNIENYINKKKFTTFNEDTLAFYNLYFTKSRIFDTKIIINDIDVLKQKFPNEKDAIDRMKEITIESMIH